MSNDQGRRERALEAARGEATRVWGSEEELELVIGMLPAVIDPIVSEIERSGCAPIALVATFSGAFAYVNTLGPALLAATPDEQSVSSTVRAIERVAAAEAKAAVDQFESLRASERSYAMGVAHLRSEMFLFMAMTWGPFDARAAKIASSIFAAGVAFATVWTESDG